MTTYKKCNYCNKLHTNDNIDVMCDGVFITLTLCETCEDAMCVGYITIEEAVFGQIEYWNHIEAEAQGQCFICGEFTSNKENGYYTCPDCE